MTSHMSLWFSGLLSTLNTRIYFPRWVGLNFSLAAVLFSSFLSASLLRSLPVFLVSPKLPSVRELFLDYWLFWPFSRLITQNDIKPHQTVWPRCFWRDVAQLFPLDVLHCAQSWGKSEVITTALLSLRNLINEVVWGPGRQHAGAKYSDHLWTSLLTLLL